MFWEAIQQWLVGTRLARRLADTLFRGRARRHVAALDHLDAARSQLRTLRGLVHLGHTTRFGRDHDFRRIRSAEDFRRLVPLRTLGDFWRDYWQPVLPDLAGASWPGPIPSLIATPWPGAPYLPAPPALWEGHRAAALSALSFVASARPESRLFSGRMLLVDESPPAVPLGAGFQAGSFESLALREVPSRLRPYVHLPSPCGQPSCPPASRLRTLAVEALRLPVTCLGGQADVLSRFLKVCKEESGWPRTADAWPGLAAVLYANGPGCDLAEDLAMPGRSAPLLLEAAVQPQGAIAVEDPRHGCLRLLVNHGVYFEFVPDDEVGRSQPVRHPLADVVPGVPYAVALTSAAGVWACLAGVRVRFESRDPPLLRVLDSGTGVSPVVGDDRRGACPTTEGLFTPPAAHPHTAGSPAGPPGTPDHSASSARADRE